MGATGDEWFTWLRDVLHRVPRPWFREEDAAAGADRTLLASVTGLGVERVPTRQDRETAVQLSLENWGDLRGGRDVDPGTSNPWRDQ